MNRAGEGADRKPVHWVGSSQDDLRDFPKEVRREVGFALQAAQEGDKATGGWKYTQDAMIVGRIANPSYGPTVDLHLPVAQALVRETAAGIWRLRGP